MRHDPSGRTRAFWAGVIAAAFSAGTPVRAQLLPATPPRALPSASLLEGPIQRATQLTRTLPATLEAQARSLLRRHPAQVALDPSGAPIVRAELLALDPEPGALDLARASGFVLVADPPMDGLDLRVSVLRAPPGIDTAAALALLRQLDPHGTYDFNHLYFGTASTRPPLPEGGRAEGTPVARDALRVGLVDTGVDQGHPALRAMRIRAWGCGGRPVPGAHGTAVASLLGVGTLLAADIYCGSPTGGNAMVFAGAMAWMARERVPVVNVSLVGPDNAVLRRATAALLARGHVMVAAVGNDGPAAAPLYPAAYDGVIGVSAVDSRGRALPEALRGPQVDFTAFGGGRRAADIDGGYAPVRGTSFAAPIVARLAAQQLGGTGPFVDASARAHQALASRARDLGRSGRDATYGDGLLGDLP